MHASALSRVWDSVYVCMRMQKKKKVSAGKKFAIQRRPLLYYKMIEKIS